MKTDNQTNTIKDPVLNRLDNDVAKLRQAIARLPEPQANTPFVVVSGLPGSGKSYFCKCMSERLDILVISSDAMRKALFSVPAYTVDESARLFQALHRLISELLEKNIPIVLDATNLEEKNREYLYHIAKHTGARFILIWVTAPPEVIKQRLESRGRRQESDNKSDADWEIYLKMSKNIDKIKRQHFVVDTSKDIVPVIDKIIREITRHN